MRRIFLTLSLLAVTLTSCAPMTPPEFASFRVLAYATDGIVAGLIPYDKLTHINYAFLIPNPDGTFVPINNAWKLEEIVQTAHKHNVHVSISVGGWGWDEQFEQMASNETTRALFVQNLVQFVDQYKLDGADIDWEYPDAGQSGQNFLALMTELRAAMPDKLLTTAVVSYGDDNGQGVPQEAFAIMDFVNIMTYDGPDHGTLEQFEKGLVYWSGRGLPKDKMVMGVPFYSRPAEISYAKLVANDPAAALVDSFEYFGQIQNYNGIPTIQVRTRVAMERAGGIMFWALDHDDLGEFSLVKAIYETIHPTP